MKSSNNYTANNVKIIYVNETDLSEFKKSPNNNISFYDFIQEKYPDIGIQVRIVNDLKDKEEYPNIDFSGCLIHTPKHYRYEITKADLTEYLKNTNRQISLTSFLKNQIQSKYGQDVEFIFSLKDLEINGNEIDLNGADLSGVIFSNIQFTNIKIKDLILRDSILDNCSIDSSFHGNVLIDDIDIRGTYFNNLQGKIPAKNIKLSSFDQKRFIECDNDLRYKFDYCYISSSNKSTIRKAERVTQEELNEFLSSLENQEFKDFIRKKRNFDENCDFIPDFRKLDLRGKDLSDKKFSNCNFEGCDFTGTNLEKGTFDGSNFSSAKFGGSTEYKFFGLLTRGTNNKPRLKNANFKNCNFDLANLNHADLSQSDISLSSFRGAHLGHSNLSGIIARSCNFYNTHLRKAICHGGNFTSSILFNINLGGYQPSNIATALSSTVLTNLVGLNLGHTSEFQEAILDHCYIEGSGLQNSDLSGSSANKANIEKSSLEYSDLSNLQANSARINNSNIQNAIVEGANFAFTHIKDTDMSYANTAISENVEHVEQPESEKKPLDLSKAYIQSSNISNSKLEGTILTNTTIQDTKLKSTDLAKSNLEGAVVIATEASRINLSNSNLKNAKIDKETNFTKANLANADISNGVLSANISSANMTGTKVNDAEILDNFAKSSSFFSISRPPNLKDCNIEQAKPSKGRDNLIQLQREQAESLESYIQNFLKNPGSYIKSFLQNKAKEKGWVYTASSIVAGCLTLTGAATLGWLIPGVGAIAALQTFIIPALFIGDMSGTYLKEKAGNALENPANYGKDYILDLLKNMGLEFYIPMIGTAIFCICGVSATLGCILPGFIASVIATTSAIPLSLIVGYLYKNDIHPSLMEDLKEQTKNFDAQPANPISEMKDLDHSFSRRETAKKDTRNTNNGRV